MVKQMLSMYMKKVFVFVFTLTCKNDRKERVRKMKKKKKNGNLDLFDAPQNAGTGDVRYSIHTINFRVFLTEKDKVAIEERLTALSKQYHARCLKKERTRYHGVRYLVAQKFGFNYVSVVKCSSEDVFSRLWMDIKVNPRWMFHRNSHPFAYIASPDEVFRAYERIQEFLDAARIVEIDYEMFLIQRIDYCVNIDMGDRALVKTYMRLMKKGAYPYKMKRKMEYSESGHRQIPTKDSFTIFSKTMEFAVYDKCVQLEKEKEKYEEADIKTAEGMIRIELRVKRSKIRYDARTNGCEDTRSQLKMVSKIASKNIPRYIKSAYGTGKFVKYGKAKRLIQESEYAKKTKKMLLDFLQEVSSKGLEGAKEKYEKDFNKCMKRFNELEISPITIEKGSKVKEMENPLYYIENKSKNYGEDGCL